MPGGDKLAAELGVGSNTAEAALALLEKEGLLLNQGRRRGRIVIAQPGAEAAPSLRIAILLNEAADLALDYIVQIRHELEVNETLKAAFPDILWQNPSSESPRWSEETGLVVRRSGNPKESTLEAWGLVDGQPTSAHYQLRVYDDVVAPESITTPDQVAKTTASWELSDNLGAVGGRKWHVGTRYSFADTYQSILDRGALRPRHSTHPRRR
jgi:hypothetical protein